MKDDIDKKRSQEVFGEPIIKHTMSILYYLPVEKI